jgi:endoglucanase
VWNKYWGYIYAQGTAPVWVGEFGTDNTSTDIESSAAGSQGQWFQSLVSYIKSNPAMGWTYWALNGEDAYDLLDNAYDPTPVSALKQSLLAGIQFPLPGAGNGTPPPSSPPPAQLSCAYSVTNSWSGGFQAQVIISNAGSGATSSWAVSWAFPSGQQLSSDWSGVFTQSGANVTVANEPYNGSISPGSSVTIGFTASGTAPSSLSVTC